MTGARRNGQREGEIRRVHPPEAGSNGAESGVARDGEDDRRESDADDLLARADRVSSDISDIIKRHPVELAALLRTTKGLTAEDIARLARQAQKAKEE
jgi:hypothetical protein